jgi:putative ABC transport system substrate-binding protein
MKRRTFIAGVGSAAAWPLVARAQQRALPEIGFLSSQSAELEYKLTVPFLQGLKETGYVEGQNVAIEYRYAANQMDRLPALAADLVHRRVAVLVAAGTPATTIPIVFSAGGDPVALGLVASLNRPGANVTGIANLSVVRKNAEQGSIGTDSDLETAFATFSQQHIGAILVRNGNFFSRRMEQVATQAARHALPAIYPFREYALAGGLMSYGTSLGYGYHQVGIYTGRVLKGEKPADLPVQQITKIDLVINLKTAKALRLTIPETPLATADEVIQ